MRVHCAPLLIHQQQKKKKRKTVARVTAASVWKWVEEIDAVKMKKKNTRVKNKIKAEQRKN